MQINQTSTGTLSQTASSAGTQNFLNTSPAKIAGDVGGLLGYFDTSQVKSVTKPEKEYAKFFSDFEHIEGSFNFYFRKEDGKTLLELKPDQLDKVFLMSFFRETGFQQGNAREAGGELIWNPANNPSPVYFKKVGNNIHLYKKQLSHRSSDKSVNEIIENSDNDTLLGIAQIKAINGKNGNIAVELNDLIINDFEKMEYNMIISEKEKNETTVSFFKNRELNKEKSNFEKPKSHSKNADIKTNLIYSSKTESLSDFKASYTVSFSEIPKNNYKSRTNDDRIGFYGTQFENHDKTIDENRKTTSIARWNLGKIDPVTKKPEFPIVYYISKTIPEEYREAVKNGILEWNKAFEKTGIKDAIVVKILPDGADPSDIQYNTINFVHDASYGGFGPSLWNPFTGEIYAADISLNREMINGIYKKILLYDKRLQKITDEKEREKYIQQRLNEAMTSLTIHEVGHTLGLLHNFEASTKQTNGNSASIMDYNPDNFNSPDGKIFQTELGEYDYLAIEYGYKPINAKTPEEEKTELDKIINKMYQQGIPYGNESNDPSCNIFDKGNPLEYCRELTQMSKDLWARIETDFAKPGVKYEKLDAIFANGLKNYEDAVAFASKYIGGTHYRNGNVGDVKKPSEPVSAEEQKTALKFLLEEILSPAAFNLKPELLSKLKNNPDGQIKKIQSSAISIMFSAKKLNRLVEDKNNSAEKTFTVEELFEITSKGIFSELYEPKTITINNLREEIQIAYIKKLMLIAGDKEAYHRDIPPAAKQTLTSIKEQISYVLTKNSHEEVTIDKDAKTHLRYILELIKI